jgi:phytoene dehydrogenase-like protein
MCIKIKIMKNKSIAVIGAGLGGLASAAYLAQKGFNVKLFERLSRAGGVVDSFKRGNYVFEATTHQLSYYGGPKKFKDILK